MGFLDRVMQSEVDRGNTKDGEEKGKAESDVTPTSPTPIQDEYGEGEVPDARENE